MTADNIHGEIDWGPAVGREDGAGPEQDADGLRVVRPAVKGDAEGISRLLGQLHPDLEPTYQPGRVRQQSQGFVASEDGEVVGFALATFVDYGVEPHGTVEELIVDAARRGKGFGSDLLERRRDWLSSLGAEVVFVSPVDDAEWFYVRHGWRKCARDWLWRSPR